MDGELARHAASLFRTAPEPQSERTDAVSAAGPNAPGPDGADEALQQTSRLDLTASQQKKLWRHVTSIANFWETVPEIEPGMIARLAALADTQRWEVIFLTKRPETSGATAQVQTQRWLQSKGFSLPSVYVVQGSRGRIAAALDLAIVVDDRPENCLDVVVDSAARAILVWRFDEKQLPGATRRLGIGTVKSVAECLDILSEVAGDRDEPPTMMTRLMRLLGLKKEPAPA